MLRWIVGSSLRFRYIVVALAAGLIFFGAASLRDAPIDVFPEFAPPRVEVQTLTFGMSASEVEQLVTVPIEQALTGIPGLDEIRSKSVEQLSSIEMIFEPGTDLLGARQHVAERIGTITPTLPRWASPPYIIQPLSATSRVMKIGLSSDEVGLMDLSMTAYWKIRARLLRVPGVANVPIWGERLKMITVQVDPERLRELGLPLDRVMESTADALDAGLLQFSDGAVIGTGGWIETEGSRLTVRHVLPIFTAEDLAKVVIEDTPGKDPVMLQDVATVKFDHQLLHGDAVINDGLGLMMIVEKLPWGNTLDVTRGVEQALEELRPGLPGIDIDPEIFRPATFIEDSIDNLTEALVIGAILMIVMLAAFLYEWRTALISVVAIPLSLIAAAVVLAQSGATINTMVLAGFVIALGDIVDDAIIDIENVVRRLREARSNGITTPTWRIILEASLEVRSAIVYATLIEVAAILPIFLLEGLSGSFFRPLATAYALALLASMVVALTVTPAMSLIFFRNEKALQHRESPLVPPMVRVYEAILNRIIYRPKRVYAAVGLTTIMGLAALPFLGQSLLPSFKERDFLMHWLAKPGTSHDEMVRSTTDACIELRSIPGVRNCGVHIGQAFNADEVVGIDFAENWVSVDPSVDYDGTVEKIHEVVDGYPGLYRDVLTYLKERIREVLTGTSEAVVVRIYGDDLEQLRRTAADLEGIISEIPGTTEVHSDLQEEIPQIQVEVRLEDAQRFGIKPGDVRRAAATLIAGEEVGDIFYGNRAYDVQVWSTPDTRGSITDVGDLLLDTPSGDHVRLEQVADVTIEPTPNVIHHEGTLRNIDVGANLDGSRDLGSVVNDLDDRLEEYEWPLGYRAELLGEFTERQAAQQRLFLFAFVAIVAIFLLLQASFGSWRLAGLMFATLPIALVGGVLAASLSDGTISLGSLVGFLTVLGIVARNGVMLVSHYQHLERFEGERFGPELVIRGAKERLIPIMMTVLTTGLALIPLIVTGSVPGQEIEHPMAVVILGGLVTATLLNLFVVPALYLRFGKSSRERAAAESVPPMPA